MKFKLNYKMEIDTQFIDYLETKASGIKEKLTAFQLKADSLFKEAKEVQDKVDVIKSELNIMIEASERYKNLFKSQAKEYKVLVVGDIGTGKTSIIKRSVHDLFSINYKATIGVDFAVKKMKDANLQLVDIAGQERFGNMTRVYYQDAVAAFVVCDITRNSTLEGAIKWKQDLDTKISIPVILLVNKIDLVDELPDFDELVKKCNFVSWIGVSAKDTTGIELAMNEILSKINTVKL